jgi:hypothetical protein
VRVIGLLNWYDERPSWLAACVASMSNLCDFVVAFDGAYARFPTLSPRSSPDQAETIARTANGLGMACVTYSPREKWWGGEVEKRAALFNVASAFATPDDWFLVLDADEELQSANRNALSATDLDVAEIQTTDGWGKGLFPVRRLFRALPGITVEQAHYVVTARKDGRKVVLCGNPDVHAQESPLFLPDVRIIHRAEERDPERKQQKADYYAWAMPAETLEAI